MKSARLLSLILGALTCSSVYAQDDMPKTTGQYTPDWESLSQWECPEWFKDAKFGIWAHWGPQCQAEDGDWYGRAMYMPGNGQHKYHVEHFGNPAEYGLKELCRDWTADNWQPKELIDLYKSVGARYFMTLANHHDNFDLWDSPYQEWNSVKIGPHRNIVGEWAEACREVGLPFGVSVHGAHTWTWLEPSQAYDGNLTEAEGYELNPDGTEKWWRGLDPQELYAQRHPLSEKSDDGGAIHRQWDWEAGASIPDEAYRNKLMNRTLQLAYDYNPDIIYFDDTVLPFWGCDEQWGPEFLASYYNHRANSNGGQADVVITGKQMPDSIKRAMMWDVERGIPDRMQEEYWQTCTCIGQWHYDRNVYKKNKYKSAATVIRMLVDVISKNGNLLLSIPVRADGTIDEKEQKILADIKAWMDVNGESIYGTRVWSTFGEGPLAEAVNPMNAQGFNEGQKYTSADVRYVSKEDRIYATIMAWPE
ncbi:MAG: alpha-L-fucosidase, partial [Muribaculaceae bacterium]|nr:alpha-L-fucosidase [Muribaculaceae bacterium]